MLKYFQISSVSSCATWAHCFLWPVLVEVPDPKNRITYMCWLHSHNDLWLWGDRGTANSPPMHNVRSGKYCRHSQLRYFPQDLWHSHKFSFLARFNFFVPANVCRGVFRIWVFFASGFQLCIRIERNRWGENRVLNYDSEEAPGTPRFHRWPHLSTHPSLPRICPARLPASWG